MIDQFSPHATHCCKRHGCKYGDDDCPVVAGLSEGTLCEECEEVMSDDYIYYVAQHTVGMPAENILKLIELIKPK